MTREEMIKELIEEMQKVTLFRGKYDARSGLENFMFGIGSVMEWLGYQVSDEYGQKISDDFHRAMEESEEEWLGHKVSDKYE